MTNKKRVIAYIDGSNFYHHLKNNYGITKINYADFVNHMLNLNDEYLVKIKYFNSPINQEENPTGYISQQKFFAKLRSTSLVNVFLGNLVKRPLHKIHITCTTCGHQESESLQCPKCKRQIGVNSCFRYTEKGVDVQLATNMLIDALKDSFDKALLISSDADYCPAIKYIVKNCKKEVIYCHFPAPRTNQLIQTCTSDRLITKNKIENSSLNHI
ncbi:MAG: NYN domain-containing protein [Candidatus Woesearchaeota archaeon]